MIPGMEPTPHVLDAFIELLAYVQSFRSSAGEKQPAYEPVRKEVLRLLNESERGVEKGTCTAEEYDQARYAVCAWVDEMILGSSWNYKGRWRPELLQRVYYHSADAGEQFFQRLHHLAAHEKGVREVYFLCLALGFKGRYCAPDDAYALEQLKERNLKLLFNGAFESPSVSSLEKETLFPEGYAQKPLPGRAPSQRRQWIWGAVLAAPAFLFILLFFIYRFALSNVGENILRVVRS